MNLENTNSDVIKIGMYKHTIPPVGYLLLSIVSSLREFEQQIRRASSKFQVNYGTRELLKELKCWKQIVGNFYVGTMYKPKIFDRFPFPVKVLVYSSRGSKAGNARSHVSYMVFSSMLF